MAGIVEIEGVTVSYRENVALKNISLNIDEGTFFAVIGPNGAGKTTLLTVINGLGKILSGSVRVFGMDLLRNSSKIRREIGYVPQNSTIDPRSPISVRDVVMIGRLGKIGLFRNPSLEDNKTVDAAMDLVGIRRLQDRPIGHLSSGEQQKVAIARALAQRPKIILLDEPTSNLDPRSQREIIDLIDRIYKEVNLTVVFVTHLLSHIPESCQEAVLMKEGKIIFFGRIEDAFQDHLLSDLYDCPVEVLGIENLRFICKRHS
ncbi:MAG: ABC transporter ATP-binding protein [Nitrospirota bacterium]|nr:ABC transporter ATP-binding protein [Nitrospirota bacterium]